MRTSDIIRRAGRNLGQAKGRTFLTALAIAVGALTIMMSLAAGAGTRDYTQKLIESNVDPQTVAISKGADSMTSTTSPSGLREYSEDRDTTIGISMLTKKDITKIEQLQDVEWVEPFAQIQSDWIRFEGRDKRYTSQVGAYDAYVRGEAAAGSLPDRGEQLGEKEAVVPESFATVLGVDPGSLVGKELTIMVSSAGESLSEEQMQALYREGGMEAVQQQAAGQQKDYVFTIRAVTKPAAGGMLTGAGQAHINSKIAQEISDYSTKGTSMYQRYYSAVARANDGVDPVTIKDRIEAAGDYDAMTSEEAQQMVFQFVNVLQYIVFGFGVLALIASVFGIINTQYISVLERTSQIGLMKALGASNRSVGKLFRYQAAWIGFLGGVIGIGLAWVAIFFLNPWINETLDLGEGNYLLKFEWLSAAVLLVGLIVVAIAAGYFPARKAAKLDPIEALRTE